MNISILNKLLKQHGHNGKEKRIRPEKAWGLILSVTILLFIGVAVWSYFYFQTEVNRTELEGNQNTSVTTSTISVETVTKVFSDREVKRKEYEETRHFIDPSR